MGFLDALMGKTKILSFEILCDSENNITVNISEDVPTVQLPDYIRLWAHYQSKIIYNLGFPNNVSANISLGAIGKIAEEKFNENIDCFKRAQLNDVAQYTDKISTITKRYHGEFFGKGATTRFIKTHLPFDGTEQEVVYSAIALMQYCIDKIKHDPEMLDIFYDTNSNMVAIYNAGHGGSIGDVAGIPYSAYMEAIGALGD